MRAAGREAHVENKVKHAGGEAEECTSAPLGAAFVNDYVYVLE